MSTCKPATLNISIMFVLVGPTMCLPTPSSKSASNLPHCKPKTICLHAYMW